MHLLVALFLNSVVALAQSPSGPTSGDLQTAIPSGSQSIEQQPAGASSEDPNLLPSAPKTGASKIEPPKTDSAKPAKPNSSGVVSITKVVGEVGDQFITSREVKINAAIEHALSATAATPAPSPADSFKLLTGLERTFPSEVANVLDEWAVYFEARSLGSTSVNKAAEEKAVAAVEEKWGGQAAWKDLEVGADELRVIVERKLAAAEFQKLKSDPALSPVSDDEALAYYKKNRLRFGSLPYSSFEQNIKAYLVKTQVEKRLAEWHDVLRKKYKTRNFIAG